MKKKILHIILTLTLFVTSLQITAQTFPVQVIPQVTPPPPVYLSDYANASNSVDRIKATVLLTDLTVSSRQVRLKLYIEGNGITAQSRDFVIGAQPLFLDGGVPLQLGTIDLAPYFELQNLQGISAGAYANTLPEGLYQFCFEVYDVLSGNRISKKSCTDVLIFLNEPPFLNLPQNNINLEAVNPQNILFQWTPRHINVSNVEYEFSIVEIWDFNMDPQAVFVASPPFYQTTTRATSLLYGIAEPQLLEGKRYAWRVKAKAIDGIDEIGLFSNNGFSEIFAFTYQGECAEPTYLSVEEVGTKTATFRWQGDIDNLNYRIGYRKAVDQDGNTGQANTFEWFENDTTREEFVVIDLEPDTMYEWRVGGYCADGTLTFTEPTTFTTMNEDAEAYYNCGIEPSIDIANQVLLETLQVGDVVKAGDFNVKIQEVDGTNSFTGKGYTTVGFLKNIKIALVFTNIQVNTSYQFVSGEIKTIYDPTWSNILDVDDVIDEFEDIVDVFTGDDIVIIAIDFDIEENDINVDTENGQIIITNPETGETATYDYDSGDTYTITDDSGDRFEIDANGNVTQTGTGAEGGAATAANTFGITDGHSGTAGDPSVRSIEKHPIAFTYRKGADTKYELDEANNTYEKDKYHKVTIDGTENFYYPVHKVIVEGGETDSFYVDVNNVSTYIKTDSLIFKTVSGTKVDAVKDGTNNTYKITVKGRTSRISEEVIITYKDNDDKQHVLSSFFIYHIKKFPTINVNVVLVNGASNIDGLQAKLDAIYKPTGVSFNVNSSPETLTIAEADWDIDVDNGQIDYNGSGLADDHPEELKAIKKYYKDQYPDFDSKAYYLFVLDDTMPVTKALAGFMPKKNQWGFLFEAHSGDNIQQKEDFSTIAAHELGHGVFALGHPFGEDETKYGDANTWLMDYSNGIELAYPNWAKMSSDALQLYLFQDDGDNEYTDKEYFEKVLQQLRCAYISGSDELIIPNKYSGGVNKKYIRFDYGLNVASSEINGEKIGSGQITIPSGATKITGIQNAEILPTKGQINFTNFEISVSVPSYSWNNGITPFEHFKNYLFPSVSNVQEDFHAVWEGGIKEKIDNNQNLSSDDIDALKKIASCATKFLTPRERFNLVKAIFRFGQTEPYEDLVLDIFDTVAYGDQNDLDEFMSYLEEDFNYFKDLYSGMTNSTWYAGNEDNKNRFLNTLYVLWSGSDFSNPNNQTYNYNSENSGLLTYDGGGFITRTFKNNYSFNYTSKDKEILVKENIDEGDLDDPSYTNRYFYHFMQPIRLAFTDSQEGLMFPSHDVPVFYLMGIDETKDYEALMKSANLTFDVILTFSGAGNLTKVKNLPAIYRTAKIIISSVEITSSMIDIVITYTNACNGSEEFCASLKKYIFWVQVASFSSDLLVDRMIKKSAREALEKVDANSPSNIKNHLDNVIKASSNFARGVTKENFLSSIDEFIQNPQLGEEAWILFKDEKWSHLESLIKRNDLNGSWPPNFGFRSIVKTEKGKDLSGKTFDRFQGPGDISGRYASPVYQGENTSDLYFTYDSRALSTNIKEGTNYVKFKFNENIPDDVIFEYGDIIPWFRSTGLGDQIKSSKTLKALYDNGIIEIVEQLEFKSGKWEKIK